MCGILVHNFDCIVQSPLFHRGPDSNGYVKCTDCHLPCCQMHHSRLAIQDTSDAAGQPFSKRNGTYLLYNGEIYNHKELRSKYFSTVEFTTSGDTELLYNILISERYDLLDKIEGIFAFVFHNKNQIIYARDPFGVKPLFKFDNNKNFALTSELEILFQLTSLKVNDSYLPELIKYRYIGLDKTIYKNVSKVLPGRIYIKDEFGVSEKIYTTVFDNIDKELSIDEDEILFDLKSTVESQLIADVEVGLLLSGGIDSTLTSKFVPKNTKTFSSIFFQDFEYDESKYIDTIQQKYGLQNIKIPFTKSYYEKNLSSGFFRRGGVSHPHIIAFEQIAQEASRHVKVLLSGEGADEIFLGYDRYKAINDLDDIIINEQYLTNKDARKLFNWSNEKEHMANNSRIGFLRDSNKSLKGNLQMLEVNFHLSFLLQRLDYTLMKYSVEGRVPFLGQSFAKKMFGITYEKLMGGPGWYPNYKGKRPLKNIVSKEFGDDFAFRRKIGFTTPFFVWMHSDFCHNLIVSTIKTSDIVNKYIKKIHLDDICNRTGIYNTNTYEKLFWSILNLNSLEV